MSHLAKSVDHNRYGIIAFSCLVLKSWTMKFMLIVVYFDLGIGAC